MHPILIRAGRRVFLICLLAMAGPRSIGQPHEAYRDSLYTYAYFKHRLHLCGQRFTIPRFEQRRLQAVASVADSLARRWPAGAGGPDAYLPYWAAHPELDEAAARATFGLAKSPHGGCIADTSGYAASRKRLTALRLAAYQKKHDGDTQAVLALLDTIGREYAYTNAPMQAKRLAIAGRDSAAYLRALRLTAYSSFAEARRKELRWPVATTAEQTAFVAACLQGVDSNIIQGPTQEFRELRRCISSFADLQNLCSENLIVARSMPPFLQPHKLKRRRIYCFIAEETYTAMPGLVCRYLNMLGRFPRISLSELDYLSLHLMQLNAGRQIYPDSLFENYLEFIRQLAYAGKADMEDYAALRDEYLTGIRGLPSEYGYTVHGRGPDGGYGYVPSPAVQARREAEGLLPLEVVADE